ncbi:MAG: DUF533 domain-containing protein [Gammaproteobacteria bacterium]|nr:DUF533 domain-containing protein [Gammaproteobacteria bacterium]
MDVQQLLKADAFDSGFTGSVVASGLLAELRAKTGPATSGTPGHGSGLEVLGDMTYQAYRRYRLRFPEAMASLHEVGTSRGLATAFDAARRRFLPEPADVEARQRLSRNLLQAMVTAAKDDAAIDNAKVERIDAVLRGHGIGDNERDLVMEWLCSPADPVRVAMLARNTEEAAALYLASLLAVAPDQWCRLKYLEDLLSSLAIDPQLAVALEKSALGSIAIEQVAA